MIRSLRISAIFAFGLVFSLAIQAQTEAQRAAIEERIKPHGQVCLRGDTDCGGAAVAPSDSRSGAEVYDAACMVCHTAGVAGAPMLGDAAGWVERIAKGVDVLYDSSINGLPGTGMIAMGGCMNCSDDEVKAAVDHMLESVR